MTTNDDNVVARPRDFTELLSVSVVKVTLLIIISQYNSKVVSPIFIKRRVSSVGKRL